MRGVQYLARFLFVSVCKCVFACGLWLCTSLEIACIAHVAVTSGAQLAVSSSVGIVLQNWAEHAATETTALP